jgi:hypothetical protein
VFVGAAEGAVAGADEVAIFFQALLGAIHRSSFLHLQRRLCAKATL